MNLNDYADADLIDADSLTQVTNEAPPIKALRQALDHLYQTLDRRFLQGEPIRTLVFGRTWAMDQILTAAWHHFDWLNEQNIALVAVGGYGRGELLPKSDIDLLLLFDTEADIDANVDSIQAFLTLMWDLKLDIGHSVRTLEACQEEARGDVTITTNLMESRTLSGNPTLRQRVSGLISQAHIWPSDDFYKAKLNEQTHRHQKYNETEYNLEPNVKAGPGGLRDIQTIAWVAKRHFGDTDLAELVERGFLTDAEYQALIDGQDYLWRIRYALHHFSGREEDRLLFDLQEKVAEQFGYQDREGQLAVEHLMQDYFRQVFKLRALNIMLLQLFDEAILHQNEDDQLIPINSRFQVRNGYIETLNETVFIRTPSALLEIFVLCAQRPDTKGIRASTIRQIFANRHRINGKFRQDLRNITFFMELLRSPAGVSTNLMRMNQYGILGRYLPEFGLIVGQMQYDLFHVFTVDAHTLLTIRNLRRFRHANNTVEFPIATKVIHQLPKVELAYIAALYHDIGKGRGTDHSVEGAEEVRRFALRHRMTAWESDLVVWLVRNHLLMSITAQRLDISDPEVINHFTQQVRDIHRLNYLYVLTVADIYATNPNLWNSWRASLLKKLYHEAMAALRRGLENPIDKEERIRDVQSAAMAMLRDDGFTEAEILQLWDNPGDDYFLRESPENIAWHTRAIANHGLNVPLVLIRETDEHSFAGATQIFIYAPDRPHLFADIAACLDSCELDIQDARIMTSSASDFSLDTFIVLDEEGHSIGNNPARLRDVQHRLLLAIQDPEDTATPNRRLSRRLKHFSIAPIITVSNDPANHRTVVEVITSDRPGLLADIGRAFKRLDLRMQSARISTLGERVEDVFFVVDNQNEPLHDSHRVAELQKQLTETIDQGQHP
ncbi:[protein-PII] uridylyltransferase [Saccharospirillum alexandrii]|uniref:[protein-PII] uridylyltransferase n=1 Tax=Saccharospirillum alexandrii TaxID=2448477 RepID=UPI000FDAFFBE|nr:[protein-PII] uridylyltransferase [Saccharospirillum alexandrii]